MDSRRMFASRALALTLLALAPSMALAQNMEAEWRVVSTVSPTVVPEYQGQPNPFPTIPLAQAQEEAGPTEEDISEAERTKAEILSRARALINSNAVFRPNLSGIAFDGYLKGAQGERVFAQGRWHGVGSAFSVPVAGAAQAYNTIQSLREIDPALADEVTAELNARLSASNRLELKITSVSPKEVVLSGPGGPYRLPVRQGGF